jgi:hypothetical protein
MPLLFGHSFDRERSRFPHQDCKLLIHPLNCLRSEILADIELVELEDDLELLFEKGGWAVDMRLSVVFNKLPKELEKDQDLRVHSKAANRFKHQQSLELKLFYFELAATSFLSDFENHCNPRLVLFCVWHVLVVIADEDDCDRLHHAIDELRIN